MRKRLAAALVAYAILGVIAWFLLEGNFRYAVLALFGLFAARSVVAIKGGLVLSRSETRDVDSDSDSERQDR